MSQHQTQTPVVFVIFNRPNTTARVFAEITRARPSKLLIIADGPRADRPAEAEKVAAVRKIVEQIDWPCDVLRNYSDANLGCRRRVSSGLDWAFRIVEEAIILEDDCVPHPSFFGYCQYLLEKYRSDERIMHIGGSRFVPTRPVEPASYYFSRYAHVWGWASWRRAWSRYDVDMNEWHTPTTQQTILKTFRASDEARFWKDIWDRTAAGEIDTWDYQWAFACIASGGLAINPSRNLVENIGSGPDATHTTSETGIGARKAYPMPFPLVPPKHIVPDSAADTYTQQLFFSYPDVVTAAFRRVKSKAIRALQAWSHDREGRPT